MGRPKRKAKESKDENEEGSGKEDIPDNDTVMEEQEECLDNETNDQTESKNDAADEEDSDEPAAKKTKSDETETESSIDNVRIFNIRVSKFDERKAFR